MQEWILGTTIGLAVFLQLSGVAVLPWLFLGGSVFLLFAMLKGKALPPRFELVAGGGISFEQIGGQEVAKREFKEALAFLSAPQQATILGIRPLKGILLSGPPGTGKTLLAKAAAHYTHSAFIAASGSEFVQMYAGVGAQRVRELFQRAQTEAEKRQLKTAVIFIDELEVLGGKRGQHSSHLEYDQTLNELLVQMDGLTTGTVEILVVGATNRADLLDPALLRPGRFDRIVQVDLPDSEGRLEILKIHTKGKPLAEDVDLEALAKESFGFSGAHLESLTNEAAIGALRRGKSSISLADFREAIDKVIMGEKLLRRPTKEERLRIAYHELGHALLAELNQPGSVAVVTISSRGQALGYTRQAPPLEQYLYTARALRGQIRVCLAGSAAEELFLGDASTGGRGDNQKAVELAKQIIEAGLSPVGIVSFEDLPPELLHQTVGEILAAEGEKVREELTAFQSQLESLAQVLLQEEKIQGAVLRQKLGFEQVKAAG